MSKKVVYPSLDRLAELQELIAVFAAIERAVYMPTTDRHENDVEHSFSLALTCWYLVPHIAPYLDIGKVLRYALAHDIVEVHAGDTWAFDEKAVDTKSAREDQAQQQLIQDWHDFPELSEFSEGYKDKADSEAKFVYTIDKILPAILTKLRSDKNYWPKRKVTREMHEAEKRQKMRHSPEALPYLELLNKWMAEPDLFYKPDLKSNQQS